MLIENNEIFKDEMGICDDEFVVDTDDYDFSEGDDTDAERLSENTTEPAGTCQ